MTAVDVVARLFNSKDVTAGRVKKAQRLAQHLTVDWSVVLASMTDEQRKVVENAG